MRCPRERSVQARSAKPSTATERPYGATDRLPGKTVRRETEGGGRGQRRSRRATDGAQSGSRPLLRLCGSHFPRTVLRTYRTYRTYRTAAGAALHNGFACRALAARSVFCGRGRFGPAGLHALFSVLRSLGGRCRPKNFTLAVGGKMAYNRHVNVRKWLRDGLEV